MTEARKISASQSFALSLIHDCGAKGVCTRYVWKFTSGHTTITAAVKALEAKGFVTVSYYRDGASVDLTAKGREAFGEDENGQLAA